MSTENRDASLLKLLVLATRAVERRVQERLSPSDLRPAHFAVFRYLDPAGSKVTALAEAAGMTQQSMGELVTHLEQHGYVERRVDPRDRRVRLVVATARGRRVLVEAASAIAGIERDLALRLGDKGLAELRRLLGDALDTLA
ncbi:MarR family winged helix-turn-helix transcriptional regulator [Amycolatopsis taiwanensis]|uniref:HTH marR-type domain-containing protein n=1 Tax=Amycolatopsis taiwanensis TaxID=342230 RepID=A0A9W6QX52_9PSEU|nr:MarR family transcriptional regulator [Amycolatopsis taiwanensis]GLY65343.1 hypothetical protein Atai01_19620 [Amycolatopsis taiwanensis]